MSHFGALREHCFRHSVQIPLAVDEPCAEPEPLEDDGACPDSEPLDGALCEDAELPLVELLALELELLDFFLEGALPLLADDWADALAESLEEVAETLPASSTGFANVFSWEPADALESPSTVDALAVEGPSFCTASTPSATAPAAAATCTPVLIARRRDGS